MAQELKLCWPLQDNQTDEVLEKLFYPQLNNRPQKREPDYDYIRKELLRNGVSKKLLWTEYMEDCRANGERTTHVFTSSAITSNRMNKNIVLPCISTANLANRLRWTGW